MRVMTVTFENDAFSVFESIRQRPPVAGIEQRIIATADTECRTCYLPRYVGEVGVRKPTQNTVPYVSRNRRRLGAHPRQKYGIDCSPAGMPIVEEGSAGSIGSVSVSISRDMLLSGGNCGRSVPEIVTRLVSSF